MAYDPSRLLFDAILRTYPKPDRDAETAEWNRRRRVEEGHPDAVLTPREEASRAGRLAYNAAEAMAITMDRCEGDYGEHADALASITARIAALHDEARALLGEDGP